MANAFDQLSKGNEVSYCQQQELSEQIRRRQILEAEREELGEVMGVADEEILATLQELGYTRETVRLLYLVPLLQAAWASGSVTARERELVLEAAASCSVTTGSRTHQQLTAWLNEAPEQEFFAQTLRVIRDITALLPSEKRAAGRQSLIALCTNVATASGGILGFGNKISEGEQQALNQIVEELTTRNPAAVQHVIAAAEEST